MTDTSVVFNVIAKDTGVGAALGRVKDLFRSTGKTAAESMTVADIAVEKLNADINDAKGNLRQLALEFAAAGTAAERSKLSAAMNRQNSSLNKLTKAKDLIEDVPEAAESIGSQLANGIRTKMQELGPLGSALIPAAAELAPFIGATIGAAVVGAAGIGGVAGGVILAAKDPAVKAATAALGTTIGDTLTDAAKPFVPATLDAISTVKQNFKDQLAPTLHDLFSSTAGYLQPLTAGVLGLVNNVATGFTKAAAAAGPVIQVISDELPALGDQIGNLFGSLADHSTASAAALKSLFGVVNNSLGGVTTALTGLVTVYGTVSSLLGKIPGLTSAIGSSTLGPIGMISNMFDLGSKSGGTFRAVLKATGDDAEAAAQDFVDLRQAVDDYTSSNLSLDQANLALNQSIADTGKQLDSVSKKKKASAQDDRDNKAALYQLATSINTVTTANDKTGTAAGKANAIFEESKRQLIRFAEQAGYSKTAATNLATSILRIPAARNTVITASTATAASRIQHVRDLLNGVHNRSISVSVLVADSQLNKVQNTLDRLGARAAGGPISKGSPYIVGEQGPEMIVPDANGTVLSATKTKALVAGGGTGGRVLPTAGGQGRSGGQTLTINVQGERKVAELFRYLIRTYNLVDGAIT